MKYFSKIIFISFLFITFSINATRIYQKTLKEFLADFPATKVSQCTSNYSFNHNPFPLYPEFSQKLFPPTGKFLDIFLLEIPNATAYFHETGYVFINNSFIKETQIRDLNFFAHQKYIDELHQPVCIKVPGRVAIVFHLYPYCYGHWVLNILSQLALLEINNIEYDYLCIQCDEKFMKESLDLWNLDRNKIILHYTKNIQIEANSIIIPTTVCETDFIAPNANYYIDFLLDYVRNKMLAGLKNKNFKHNFPEKIFISRKDALGKRAIPNEDEVFELFKPLGFVRYELRSLSLIEQIALFAHAKTIVSFAGSGGTNIIFCKPGTHYVEITQKMVDATFFFLADAFHLKYSAINDSTEYDLLHGLPHAPSAPLSLDCVKNFIAQNPDL